MAYEWAGPADDNVASWSHDGNWIYCSSNRSGEYQIWKIPAEGGAAVQMRRNGGIYPAESWDGSSLYDRNARSRWRMTAEGGLANEVLSGPLWGKDWALSRSGITYLTRTFKGRRREVVFQYLDFASGQVTELFRKEGPIWIGYPGPLGGRPARSGAPRDARLGRPPGG